MGQYFIIVNTAKKQFIHPHRFGDGLKLLEFGCSSGGTLTGLTLLLRQSNDGGGGDFPDPEKFPIVGSWAGDPITIVGDYDGSNLFHEAEGNYKDVSDEVLTAMLKTADPYLRKDILDRLQDHIWNEDTAALLKRLKLPLKRDQTKDEARLRPALRPDMVIGPEGAVSSPRIR